MTAIALAGIIGVGTQLADPWHRALYFDNALRQLDMLYLDEPAPPTLPARAANGPVVAVVCSHCTLPQLDGATVVRVQDSRVAGRLALLTPHFKAGPGYALIDSTGRLRYRTFDPAPGEHAEEIQILVEAL